jgi:hypothetical protein
MKTHILQLERHDDVTAIRDKIIWSKASRVLLVWPKRGRVLPRSLDLLLVQRACLEVGAQLACVTDDDDILDHAKELGIPVFSSVKVALRLPWRRQRWKKIFEPKLMRPLAVLLKKREDARPKGWAWPNLPLVRWSTFFVGVLAVLGLILGMVPEAKIRLALKVEKQSLELPVYASLDLSAPDLSGGIPARVISVVVEGQNSQETTGSMLIPEIAASGKVQFTNLTNQAVVIPSGTIIQTLKDPVIQFETNRSVELPGKPGAFAEVMAQAAQAGSQGNVAAGTIRAIGGAIGSQVAVTNPARMSGGQDLRTRAASREDGDQLKDRLMDRLKQNALQEIGAKVAAGSQWLPQTLTMVKILEERQEPPPGLSSDQIKLTLRVEFQALTIRAEDRIAIAQMALDTHLPPGKIALAGSLSTEDIDPPAVSSGRLQWRIRATRAIRAIWNDPDLIKAVAGQNPAAAQQNLARIFDVTETPQIEIYPDGWPFVPLVPGRIQVEVR